MRMAYELVIENPHIVTIDGATREHLVWIREQQPKAVFNYKVVEHRIDGTLLIEFHFEDEAVAAIFRLFHA